MARKSRVVGKVQEQLAELEYKWKVAIYVRLSVEDGDDVEQNSIGNQKKLCMAYMQGMQDVTLVNVYMDHGFTGMNYNRPGFQDMYDAIVRGDVNCVIVKDVSRFGRHYIITSEYLQRTFPDMGVRFVAINDDYDSLHPNVDVEGLLLPFKMILNDSYAKDTSKKIRSSITAKMNAGEYLPSRSSIPYGYVRNAENNTFDVDLDVAPVITRIFQMRSQGIAFNRIARILNDEGIPSPGKYRYLRGISKDKRFIDAEWISSTLRKILTDPVYLGSRIHGKVKRDKLGDEKKRRPQDEWQILEGMHDAIITQELFDAVQIVNQNEQERLQNYGTGGTLLHDLRPILRDKLYCGECGSRMSSGKRNQRKTSSLPPAVYFNCYDYVYSNRTRCSNHYISQDKIEKAIMTVLENQVRLASDIEVLIESYTQSLTMRSSETDILQGIRVKRKNLESKLERLLMDLTSGLIDKEEYDFTKARYLQELSILQEAELDAEHAVAKVKESIVEARQWLDGIRQFRKVPELTKNLVDLMIDRILIYEGGGIHIKLNYSDPYRDFHILMRKEPSKNGRSNVQLPLSTSVAGGW